jgi:hypothetical protein
VHNCWRPPAPSPPSSPAAAAAAAAAAAMSGAGRALAGMTMGWRGAPSPPPCMMEHAHGQQSQCQVTPVHHPEHRTATCHSGPAWSMRLLQGMQAQALQIHCAHIISRDAAMLCIPVLLEYKHSKFMVG